MCFYAYYINYVFNCCFIDYSSYYFYYIGVNIIGYGYCSYVCFSVVDYVDGSVDVFYADVFYVDFYDNDDSGFLLVYDCVIYYYFVDNVTKLLSFIYLVVFSYCSNIMLLLYLDLLI